MPSPTIRRARTSEAETLTRIAHPAKKYWGYPDHWMKHWESELTISSEFIDANEVYVFESNDEVRGFYALILSTGKGAVLEHLWVLPAHIGTGVGKELLRHALRHAAVHAIEEVQLSADPNAEGFYKKMGAYRIGDVRADIEDTPRIIPRLGFNPSKF